MITEKLQRTTNAAMMVAVIVLVIATVFYLSSPATSPTSHSNASSTSAPHSLGNSVTCEVVEWIGGPGTVSATRTIVTVGNSTITTYDTTEPSAYSFVYTSYDYSTTTNVTQTAGYVTQSTEAEDPGNWNVTNCTYLGP